MQKISMSMSLSGTLALAARLKAMGGNLELLQMLSSSERVRMGLDLAEVFDISWGMSRKTDRTPPIDHSNDNLALAQTILEAIKIKESAGLARNPFTGRACYKLTDEEAARQATSDENTARWPRQGGYDHKARWLTDADAFAAFQIAALSSAPSRICLFSSPLERILTRDVSEITTSTGI
jgi:hypothetical protein